MNKNNPPINPGPIALFGSGETAPGGQKIFDALFRLSGPSSRVKILETPAGFELNSEKVASNVGDFIKHRLQNYHPQIEIVPARKKDTDFSPDAPEIATSILDANLIFMGPGSPSFTVRQLENSLSWEYLLARHRLGGGLAFSSAATVAISSFSLPVYEIYKVGEDLHWKPGLDFFSPYGLPLVFIPHWNNQDGGKDLDTSRCYMGVSRFEDLVDLLPSDQIIVGIDENTGLVIDFRASCLHGVGQGNVTIIRDNSREIISPGTAVNLSELGNFEICDPLSGISPENWETAVQADLDQSRKAHPPETLIKLAESRQQARAKKDWEEADRIRLEIESQGWTVRDSSDGYDLEHRSEQGD